MRKPMLMRTKKQATPLRGLRRNAYQGCHQPSEGPEMGELGLMRAKELEKLQLPLLC